VIELLPEPDSENPENKTQKYSSKYWKIPEKKEKAKVIPGFEMMLLYHWLLGRLLNKR